MGQNRCARSDSNHVWLILMKSVLNEKGVFPQMIKVCEKKFSCFLRKNRFLAVFVILEKITKTDKNSFFLWKGGNFFRHTLNIWENSTFSFSIILDLIKKSKKGTFLLFLAQNCPSFNFEGQKVLKIKVFMESLQNRDCHIQPN